MVDKSNLILALLVPCYNEEEVIIDTNERLLNLIYKLIKSKIISPKSYIYYVDDGSSDKTWGMIKKLHINEKRIKALKLSKNFGHQNALIAGLNELENKCDFVISIDADLQQDINVIPMMIDKYNAGSEIVFGIRKNRSGDTIFKKATGVLFNKIFKILGGNIIEDHADFRLLGGKALKALLQYTETNIFIRGIVPNLGFKTSKVKFEQSRRRLGKTKYSLMKMFNLAYNGISSLSTTPLRFLFFIGFFSTLISLFWTIYVIYAKYYTLKIVPGWASIILSIWFFSSLQLMALGLIGEYLSKVFLDVKKRPRYIVESRID